MPIDFLTMIQRQHEGDAWSVFYKLLIKLLSVSVKGLRRRSDPDHAAARGGPSSHPLHTDLTSV
jgi:hypothetical protein